MCYSYRLGHSSQNKYISLRATEKPSTVLFEWTPKTTATDEGQIDFVRQNDFVSAVFV